MPDPVEPEPLLDPPSSPVDRFDQAVDAAWGRVFRGHPLADRVFYIASQVGDFSVIWLIIAAADGLRSDEDADASIRLGLLLLAESALVNQGIKRLVRRPRPASLEEHPHHVRLPRTSSFPSGHASSALAAAGIMSHRHPKAAPLLYGLAAIVATSRVHVKVHHASDIIAGAAIGITFAKVAERVWPAPPRG
ncbi:phosphatase PAP2 family protein [Aquihabitans sp. McL0605]|uniref:phosphatase PAP2 family protein n=1 Tax=Aquihabitans sp. McL0605 TaxID=3415671 RepID=UPI003CEA38F6